MIEIYGRIIDLRLDVRFAKRDVILAYIMKKRRIINETNHATEKTPTIDKNNGTGFECPRHCGTFTIRIILHHIFCQPRDTTNSYGAGQQK